MSHPTPKPLLRPAGFLWRNSGFTRVHLYGLLCTEGVIGIIGTWHLMHAVGLQWAGGASLDQVLPSLLIATAAFALCAAMLLVGIFVLLFYLGAHQLGLLAPVRSAASTGDDRPPLC